MSEQYDDDDLNLENEETNDIRSLRKAANSSKKLRAELESLKREMAFARAGISMDDPRMNYFIKGYDGELDPATIRETAIQAGFIASPNENVDPAVQVQQQQSHMAQRRIMAASAGAVSEDISEEAALSRMESAMNEGGLEALMDVVRQYGVPTNIDY